MAQIYSPSIFEWICTTRLLINQECFDDILLCKLAVIVHLIPFLETGKLQLIIQRIVEFERMLDLVHGGKIGTGAFLVLAIGEEANGLLHVLRQNVN